MDRGKTISYLQDPEILLRYGGELESRCIWDRCCCTLHDNNEPYCYSCWDSREQHKSDSNLDELRKTQHKMTIRRDAYDNDIHPWIDEYHCHFEPCLEDLFYEWSEYTVVVSGDYAIPCGPNAHLLGQYILFRQIQYFFENTDREECLIFAYQHPIPK